MNIFINYFEKLTDYGHLQLKTDSRFLKTTIKALVLPLFMFAISWKVSYSQVRSSYIADTEIYPLSIGEKVPDELWNTPLQVVNDPDGKTTATLADYKGKLIILDFWATWCSPCIKYFPKVHALQNKFGDKIKILAATYENLEKINTFFKTGAGKEHTDVNSVVNDSVLSRYFPHNGVPHIVWINTKGRLVNTTRAEFLTAANIQSILDGKKTQMITKHDIDRKRPLFLSKYFGDDMELKSYSIFAKGVYPGLPQGGTFKKNEQGVVYGRQITNSPMMDVYLPLIFPLFKKKGEMFGLNRMILKVKEPKLLNLIPKRGGGFETYNLYNYELIVPEAKADSLYNYMLADLNRYSDYIGIIEKRMTDCLVLVRTSAKDKIKTKGGRTKNTFPQTSSIINNMSLSSIVNKLQGGDADFIKVPVIDETNYSGNVDMELSGVSDLPSLRKGLKKYDLDLVPAKRVLSMFVLKDK